MNDVDCPWNNEKKKLAKERLDYSMLRTLSTLLRGQRHQNNHNANDDLGTRS